METGNDLSPILRIWVPPNCTFDIDDFEADWVFDKHQHFDYIHARGIASSVSDLRQALQSSVR